MKWVMLVLLFSVQCAHAEDWVEINPTSDGDAQAFDRDKIYIEGDGISYWRKVEFRMALSVRSELAQSGLYREHIDCGDQRMRTLGYLYYAAGGAIIENVYSPDAPPVEILEGSPAGQLADVLCSMVVQVGTVQPGQPVDELDKLRREIEALQSQVHRLRRGLEVQEAAGTGR
jgi:hypothetical protein